jgi:hypothetical protein
MRLGPPSIYSTTDRRDEKKDTEKIKTNLDTEWDLKEAITKFNTIQNSLIT